MFGINETGTRSIDETASNLEGELQRAGTCRVCLQDVVQRQLLLWRRTGEVNEVASTLIKPPGG
jgi:hypothetical protein